ncbi:MAG TPA: redoxin domain-containing protein [Chloroflexi bacterium]|nr:redoxin domain-containing protein [Chloroflexota bacterium]
MELRDHYREFRGKGAYLAALVVASPDSVRQTKQALGLPYPVLADTDHRVSDAYEVYDLLGDGYAAPAVFVIDTDGQILWQYIGKDPHDRPSAQEILSKLP